ncbi:nuclear transport factor 2 family protein [Mycobacterium sp. D16Q16]|uniref:nuclear transport factor 2 family protein n=1 Tax=Mycobacterium sp. D16Q16 TaxID=1855659 RepID=UPI000992683D|nr:nuclear transport factor 2 family protein [Mycobacterium sp. D16Q16]
MGQWSRDELQNMFDHHLRVVDEIGPKGEWATYADLFAEEASYIEPTYGTFEGREAIRESMVKTMSEFPGAEMPHYFSNWHVVDEEHGWVICELVNRMKDPGDGSIWEATNISIFRYAGDNQWANEEDIYNPMQFMVAIQGYVQRSSELGSLSPAAEAFGKNMGWLS